MVLIVCQKHVSIEAVIEKRGLVMARGSQSA